MSNSRCIDSTAAVSTTASDDDDEAILVQMFTGGGIFRKCFSSFNFLDKSCAHFTNITQHKQNFVCCAKASLCLPLMHRHVIKGF